MPARRDIHTGRLNFLHRSWGPLEPFDNSFPREMRDAGVHTHLVTDHVHYFEDGGATYHGRYSHLGLHPRPGERPVEGDGAAAARALPREVHARSTIRLRATRWRKRAAARDQPRVHAGREGLPPAALLRSAFEFLELNRDADNWFLQIECFDPHEPFDAPERFKEPYETGWNGGVLDWPLLRAGRPKPGGDRRDPRQLRGAGRRCATTISASCSTTSTRTTCGRTRRSILSTDHGFLLAEHDWWGKNLLPYYAEISHIPLIVHHPRFRGVRRARAAAR